MMAAQTPPMDPTLPLLCVSKALDASQRRCGHGFELIQTTP